MNLAAWAELNGVAWVSAYRWFRAGLLPVAAQRVSRLILVDEPLSGRTGIDEDHADDLFGPALRVKARLDAAQRVSNQHIRSRYGPGVERRMQVVHHVG